MKVKIDEDKHKIKDEDDDAYEEEYKEEDEGEHGDDQEDIAHLTVIAIESIVGAPAQEHEDEAEHAEGEEEATGVDVHRDDGDARDRARD